LNEANKRTTLEDLGETLDKLVIDSKAKNWKHYKPHEHATLQPERPGKDYTSEDFQWSGKLLRALDPKTPLFIDDPSKLGQADENNRQQFEKVVEEVKFNDSKRDYSFGALSQEEKSEIALFHSMKQDPFYKHYLYNHLRQYAEEEDDIHLNFPLSSIEKEDIYDHAKFERLNLFDFRRNVPMKERASKIDSKMRAYGFGKRKKSKAIA